MKQKDFHAGVYKPHMQQKGLNELEVPSVPHQQSFITELACLQFSYIFLHFSNAILKLNAIKIRI